MITSKDFNQLVERIRQNNLAVYIGAGFSADCQLPDWIGLMTPLIEKIDLACDRKNPPDLILYAQYVENKLGRDELNKKITEAFSGGHVCSNQQNLAKLNVSEVWTTNYDSMIEKGFDEIGKKYRVKAKETDLVLKDECGTVPIYKIHGDWQDPSNCILTQTDYEDYFKTRQNFINALKTSLLQKTFVFMGFSFKDPDIKYILSEIRQSLPDGKMPEHYWIVKSDDKGSPEYDSNIENLKAIYKINAIEIDEFGDIPKLLEELRYYANRKNIFISGAYLQDDPDARKKDDFISPLASRLVELGMKIYSGYGLGVGSAVISGAMKVAYDKNDNENLSKYLDLHPFPQNISDPVERREKWTKYRKDMCAETGILIALYGCKRDKDTGEVVNSPGCKEEFEIAHGNKSVIIPIASTGFMAEEIYDKIVADPQSYGYNTTTLVENLKLLKELDPVAETDKLIDVVLAIVQECQKYKG